MSEQERISHVQRREQTEARPEAARDLVPSRLSSALLSRKIARRRLARHGAGEIAPDAGAAVDRAASSSGAPLPEDLQAKFGASLGADLSDVRVHTGGDSAEAANRVSAQAYTVGKDIHFGAGHYDPSSHAGQHLIAHEVAHTVQQAQGPAQPLQAKLEVSSPGDAHEVEADGAADAMVRGEPARVGGGAGLSRQIAQSIARKPTGTDKPDETTDAPSTATPIDEFKAALGKKTVSDKEALAAWNKVPDKTAADEATVVLAIGKLSTVANASNSRWASRVDRG